MLHALGILAVSLLAQPQGLVLPPVPTIEPIATTPQEGSPSGEIAGITQTPFVGLSLQDVVTMALAKNTDLIVAQQNRRIARYQIIAAQGAYDLHLVIAPTYSYDMQPVTNPFFAGPNGAPISQSTLGAKAGFSGQTAAGTQYSLSASASHSNDTTSINSFNPTYATAISLNLTQPLLRGGAIDQARRQVALARVNGDLSGSQALLSASNTLVSVLDTYYDLMAAWRNVGIQEDALRQAKAQSQSNQRLVRQGAAAPLDVVESDAQVDTYQNNVFSSLQTVARLQNQLKAATLADPADPIWLANIVPSSPITAVSPEPALETVITAALKNRPEMGEVEAARRNAAINLAYAKSQARPQFDLSMGVTENGFAGATANPALNPLVSLGFPVPALPSYEFGKLGQAWSNAFNGRFPQYTLGATIGLPLRNRAALGDLYAAREQGKSVDTQQIALIQRIEVEARNAVQSYRSARARLSAAAAQRVAFERVLQGEQRKFANGQSTTFLVLQRQVTLATARGTELQAQTDLQEALVELDRASGTIFARYNVDVPTHALPGS